MLACNASPDASTDEDSDSKSSSGGDRYVIVFSLNSVGRGGVAGVLDTVSGLDQALDNIIVNAAS
jgi:hypothetical protein